MHVVSRSKYAQGRPLDGPVSVAPRTSGAREAIRGSRHIFFARSVRTRRNGYSTRTSEPFYCMRTCLCIRLLNFIAYDNCALGLGGLALHRFTTCLRLALDSSVPEQDPQFSTCRVSPSSIFLWSTGTLPTFASSPSNNSAISSSVGPLVSTKRNQMQKHSMMRMAMYTK